jgi:DNA-binding MarR family transcriptional regulator
MKPLRATGAKAGTSASAATADGTDQAAREVWGRMCDLVLDNQRRREVAEAVGLSFGRIRAIRRVARRSMSMRELADELGIDPPNATVVVDDLESLGLARRQSHPTDRRAKVVEATRKGKEIAKRADAILSTPPLALRALGPDDLADPERILDQLDTTAERD